MTPTASLWKRIKKNKIAYLWIAPFFIQFLIFWAWPIVFTFILSFQKWEIIGAKQFVGMNNWGWFFYCLLILMPGKTPLQAILRQFPDVGGL